MSYIHLPWQNQESRKWTAIRIPDYFGSLSDKTGNKDPRLPKEAEWTHHNVIIVKDNVTKTKWTKAISTTNYFKLLAIIMLLDLDQSKCN